MTGNQDQKKDRPVFLRLTEEEARDILWLLSTKCPSKALGAVHRKLERIMGLMERYDAKR